MPARRSLLLLAALAAFVPDGGVVATAREAHAEEPVVAGAPTGSAPASPPTRGDAARKPRTTSARPAPRPASAARPFLPLPPPTLDARGCGTRDGVLAHGPRREQVVAVTFDACPTTRSPGFAPEIVDLLERERVPTTFFVSGRWAETHPADFARLRSVPFFEIALHGHRHRHLVPGKPEATLAEIEEGRAALRALGAEPVAVFRPPFGDSPPELARVAERAGVTALTWDVAPGDPDPRVAPATIERGVVSGSAPGSVVVLHVNGRGVGTPKALPGLIAGLRARGLRLARVSEVLAPCRSGAPVESHETPAVTGIVPGSRATSTPVPDATARPTGAPHGSPSPPGPAAEAP